MGSSLGEAEYDGIDETVGRLVWVRRRNGSWWPGQIISVDELPKSCLLAAKPGTPVKLLGRDDASVDWYNLNKSKRVKAFRCGEFDNCIEKAKATASTNKKSVKYARREDAIIRALEIENSYELKDKDNLRVNSSAKKQSGDISTNSPAGRENCEDGDEVRALLRKGKLPYELARCGLSSAEPNEVSVAKTSSLKGKRRKTPNDSEDDGIVGVKRMRGIKDLVLDVASKIKDEAGSESDQVHQETVNKGNNIANESPANSGKSNTPSFKKKRSAVVNGNGHEYKRRKDRRRTLTKVLEECVMVSVPVTCDEISGTVGSHVMVTSDREAVIESMDSEGVTSDFVNNGAEGADDRYGNVLVSDCIDGACEPPHDDKIHKESGNAEFLASRDSGSLDELYDVHLSLDDDNAAGLKQAVPSDLSEKREIDCTNLSVPGEQVEHVPVTNGNVPESDSTSSAAAREGISYEIMKSSSKWQSKRKRNARRVTKHKKQELKNIACGLNNGCSGQGFGLKQHLGSFSLGSDLKTNSRNEEITSEDHKDCLSNWGKRSSHREIIEGTSEEATGPTRSLPYRHSRFLVPPKYEEADFPTRNIRSEPWAESSLHDVRMEVNSTYQSNHVPIVSFMSKFNGKAIIGHPLTVEIMESGYADKLLKQFTGNLSYKHCRKPRSDDGRDLKKHSKYRKDSSKSVTPSSKKTRRLSVLTGSCKSRDEHRNTVVEKPRSSAIACIPLNVVFSRLNEGINGSKHHLFCTPSNT